MGLIRNLGAVMSFGLSVTTKHKEAEAKYEDRRKQHEGRLISYNEIQKQVQSSLEALDAYFVEAQEALLSTGALASLASNIEDNVVYGWYRPQEEVESVENNPDYSRSLVGAIPAFGVGMGTPAAIWTLVGIYGTAATGTAIGTLSGAAASAATAAWIGRAVTLGLGGMTAGRIVLGPIGLATSLVTLPLGVAVSRNRERNYIEQTGKAAKRMVCLEDILERSRIRMKSLLPQMAVTTAHMQEHISQLEAATPNTQDAQDIVHKLDIAMREAASLKNELVDMIQERDYAMKACDFVDED